MKNPAPVDRSSVAFDPGIADDVSVALTDLDLATHAERNDVTTVISWLSNLAVIVRVGCRRRAAAPATAAAAAAAAAATAAAAAAALRPEEVRDGPGLETGDVDRAAVRADCDAVGAFQRLAGRIDATGDRVVRQTALEGQLALGSDAEE